MAGFPLTTGGNDREGAGGNDRKGTGGNDGEGRGVRGMHGWIPANHRRE